MKPIALLIPLLVLANPARAQSYRDAVIAQLDTVAQHKQADGFVVSTQVPPPATTLGMLPNEGYVLVELSLEEGTSYFLPAVCDGDCSNLDTRLLGRDGKSVIAEDLEADDTPILSFTAPESGPHLLVVMMRSCKTQLCYFGFQMLSR